MLPAALLIISLALSAGPERPPYLQEGVAVLEDGREISGFIDTRDASGESKSQGAAVRFSPAFAGGAFWAFGDSLRRNLYFGCSEGAPALQQDRLSCPTGAVVLRPDVTLPDDPSAYPNSNVPPVRPGGRPVTQSMHFIVPWLLPCGAALILCIGLGLFLRRRGRLMGLGLPEPARQPMDRRTLILGIGITAIGLLLRFWGLGDEPLEQNEFTYVMSALGHDDPMSVVLDINAMAQTHPPLPHLITWLFGRAGNSEFITRLPSALAAAATVFLMFLLAWRLFQNRKTAAAVGLIAAVAPVHVWYAQDASPYALTAMFAATAILFTDQILRDPTPKRRWLGLAIATWGLVYSHYYGLHLALTCYVSILIAARARRSIGLATTTVGAGFLTIAGIIPWIPAFVQAYLWSRGHSTAYQRLAEIYHPTANAAFDTLDTLRLVAGLPFDWRWLSLAGLAWFLVHLPLKALSGRRALLLLPLAWFIPFELLNRATFLNKLYGGYYFGIRYFLFLFPVAWLLAGAVVHRAVIGRGWRRYGTAVLLVLMLTLSTYESVRHLLIEDKPDVRGAARLVARGLGDGDAIVVGPAVFYQHPFHYYLPDESKRSGLRINDFMQTPAWHPGGYIGVLSDLYEPYERTLQNAHIRRVFLVDHTQHLFDRPEFSDRPSAALRKALEANFEKTWSKELHDAEVHLYERRSGIPELPKRIHFGWGDGPYVRNMTPPGAYASPGRRIERGAQVRLPRPKTGRITAVTIRMGTMPGGGHQPDDEGPPEPALLRVLVNGQPTREVHVLGSYNSYRFETPSNTDHKDGLLLTFDRQKPNAGSTRPPSIVLDWLDPEITE